jgi:cytochrome c5
MNNKLSAAERKHLARVKSLPCSVCNAPPPSAAHHINQGQQYTTVALCTDCHQGSLMGWHGQKRAWAIRKMDELDALNETIRRLLEDGHTLEQPDLSDF